MRCNVQIIKDFLLEMKTFVSMLLLALVVFFLSGCASDGGFMSGDDYAKYSGAHVSYAQSESTRIAAQSAAIQASAAGAVTSSPTEATLIAVIAMMQIERLSPVPLTLAKPTTGYDVLGKLVDHVPIVAGMAGMYSLGKVGIENAGKITIGEGATVSDALNRPTISPLGSNNTTNYTGTAPAQVVDPLVVTVPAP
jgi:hypothetical protein